MSGYRILWLFVLFDLPVGSKIQRKLAKDFRNKLLDLGFQMSQYSVYIKFCSGKEKAETLCRDIELVIPPSGKVHLIQITDKQYEGIRTYAGTNREYSNKNRGQLALF